MRWNEWMDGWKDGWDGMDGMNGWKDGWIDEME